MWKYKVNLCIESQYVVGDSIMCRYDARIISGDKSWPISTILIAEIVDIYNIRDERYTYLIAPTRTQIPGNEWFTDFRLVPEEWIMGASMIR